MDLYMVKYNTISDDSSLGIMWATSGGESPAVMANTAGWRPHHVSLDGLASWRKALDGALSTTTRCLIGSYGSQQGDLRVLSSCCYHAVFPSSWVDGGRNQSWVGGQRRGWLWFPRRGFETRWLTQRWCLVMWIVVDDCWVLWLECWSSKWCGLSWRWDLLWELLYGRWLGSARGMSGRSRLLRW